MRGVGHRGGEVALERGGGSDAFDFGHLSSEDVVRHGPASLRAPAPSETSVATASPTSGVTSLQKQVALPVLGPERALQEDEYFSASVDALGFDRNGLLWATGDER